MTYFTESHYLLFPVSRSLDICDTVTGPYWWIDRSHSVQWERPQDQLHRKRHGTGALWTKEGRPEAEILDVYSFC